jgi:hypothetical protein
MLSIAPSPEGDRVLHDLAWVALFFGATFTTAFLLKVDYSTPRRRLSSLLSSLHAKKLWRSLFHWHDHAKL